MIIGLTGYAGSGKSTIARNMFAFSPKKFARPLKAMMRALLLEQGVDDDTIRRMIEGDLKERPSPFLNMQTPRHAMQTLGTDWGRALICENLWADAALRDLHPAISYVFDDVRFDNEADAIRKAGGKIVRLHRSGVERTSDHPSEDLPWADIEVANDHDPIEVVNQIIKAVEAL